MNKYALIIGNSSGIGLGITEALLRLGWRAEGISRSQSPLEEARYRHVQAGVQEERLSGFPAWRRQVRICKNPYEPRRLESRLDRQAGKPALRCAWTATATCP